MISLSMVFNKLTGFYGLLAVLAGLKLSPLQLSMYIYSVFALALTAYLMPHIRKQSPFQCVALAWFYLIDTIINSGFTAAFAMAWLMAVSASHSNSPMPKGPGSGTISDTAGFMNPEYNVSEVNVIASPGSGAAGQDAVAYGKPGGVATASSPSLAHAAGIEESIPSIIVVVILTLIRIYFIFVVMSYARQVLRQSMHHSSPQKLHLHTDSSNDALPDNPFPEDSPEGQGWKGKLGRFMVSVGRSYWLGGPAEDSWAKGMGGRFKTTRPASTAAPGTSERERRARSGTGPPPVPANLVKPAVGK